MFSPPTKLGEDKQSIITKMWTRARGGTSLFNAATALTQPGPLQQPPPEQQLVEETERQDYVPNTQIDEHPGGGPLPIAAEQAVQPPVEQIVQQMLIMPADPPPATQTAAFDTEVMYLIATYNQLPPAKKRVVMRMILKVSVLWSLCALPSVQVF